MKDIYEKAKNGDRQVEQELFRELFVRFRHFAARKVGDEEAKEIAQSACVTILEKYKTETYTVGFQAWAYGVLKLTMLKSYQNRSRQRDKEIRLPEGFQVTISDEPHPMLRAQLLECIKSLSKSFQKYARIIILHYQGYTTGEICRKLGLNPKQYYVYVGRGRSLMRECLLKGGVI